MTDPIELSRRTETNLESPEAVDLTIPVIAEAIEGARDRYHPLILAYVNAAGLPVATFRGGIYVHSANQLGMWVRKATGGFVDEIAARPDVSIAFFDPDGPGAHNLSIVGRAVIAPALNDEVYANIPKREQEHDPDVKGVAVLVEVESLKGFGPEGWFSQSGG